jgi:hypothetical protein
MGHIRLFFSLEWKTLVFPPYLNETFMRRALKDHILTNIESLMKLPSLRQEIGLIYDRLGIRHNDFAPFIEKCNLEPFEQTTMKMMTKPAEYQIASIQFSTCADLVMLAETIDESDPDYNTKNDLLTHLHAQNIKMHAVETDLREFDIKLRADYVLCEADFLMHIANTVKENFPSFVYFMGLYHVILGGTVYICPAGVEQAMCVWACVIYDQLGGQLAGINVIPGLEKMFGNRKFFGHRNAAPAAETANVSQRTTYVEPPPVWGDEEFI